MKDEAGNVEQEDDDEVDEYADLMGNYDEFDWDGLSIAQKASAAGDYQRVKSMLKAGLKDKNIMDVLRAAAYNGQTEVAWLLIWSGAEFNYLNDGEIVIYCPVCFCGVCAPNGPICSHFVCNYAEGVYGWFEGTDFRAEVYELAQRFRKRDLPDEDFEKIIEIAPENLRVLFKRARKHHDLFWTRRGQVLDVNYVSPGYCASYCSTYFHPDVNFAKDVKDEAQAGLAWLKKNFPELCEGEVDEHLSYYGFSEEDEDKDTGEMDEETAGKEEYSWFASGPWY